jgi:hypothetical protein
MNRGAKDTSSSSLSRWPSPSPRRLAACWCSARVERRSSSPRSARHSAKSISAICRRCKQSPVSNRSPIAYRAWLPSPAASDPPLVVIAIHGSSAQSASIHPLGKALSAEGIAVYAPDIRGHGGYRRARRHRLCRRTRRRSSRLHGDGARQISQRQAGINGLFLRRRLRAACRRDTARQNLCAHGAAVADARPVCTDLQTGCEIRAAFPAANHGAHGARPRRHSRLRSFDHAPSRHRSGAERHFGRPLFVAVDAGVRHATITPPTCATRRRRSPSWSAKRTSCSMPTNSPRRIDAVRPGVPVTIVPGAVAYRPYGRPERRTGDPRRGPRARLVALLHPKADAQDADAEPARRRLAEMP